METHVSTNYLAMALGEDAAHLVVAPEKLRREPPPLPPSHTSRAAQPTRSSWSWSKAVASTELEK